MNIPNGESGQFAPRFWSPPRVRGFVPYGTLYSIIHFDAR